MVRRAISTLSRKLSLTGQWKKDRFPVGWPAYTHTVVRTGQEAMRHTRGEIATYRLLALWGGTLRRRLLAAQQDRGLSEND
jgi:hypothetical protein